MDVTKKKKKKKLINIYLRSMEWVAHIYWPLVRLSRRDLWSEVISVVRPLIYGR